MMLLGVLAQKITELLISYGLHKLHDSGILTELFVSELLMV